MRRLIVVLALATGLIAAGLTARSGGPAVEAAGGDYEVWVLDQRLDVISIVRGGDWEVVDTIDYREVEAQFGLPEEGLDGPHMILFGLHQEPGYRYGFIGNIGSKNATIVDAKERRAVAVIQNTGARTHAMQVAPDGRRALIASLGTDPDPGLAINDGRITEVLTDLRRGTFETGRSFVFKEHAVGTELASLARFDAVCASFTPDSKYAYVTFNSGGLGVFRINENPNKPLFEVVRVFPNGNGMNHVSANGCGIGYTADGKRMFATSGSLANTALPDSYYMFDIKTHTMTRRVDVRAPGESEGVRDLHGMMLRPAEKEVFMIGRRSDSLLRIDQRTGDLKSVVTLPVDAPDLMDFSPDGRWAFSTLRGPNPRSGGPAGTWNADGAPPPSMPGLAVIDAREGSVEQVVVLPGDRASQDPHGMAVRAADDDERKRGRKGRAADFSKRRPAGEDHNGH